MKIWALLFAVVVLTGFSDAADVIYLPASATEDLMSKEGQQVIVYGEVSGSRKSNAGTNFINFKEADFFLVTFKSDLNQFPDGEPAEALEGKRVAVEGSIAIYQGKPQIKLTKPAQIKLLAADEIFPPVQPVQVGEAKPLPAPETRMPPQPEAPVEPTRKPPVDPSEYFKKPITKPVEDEK